MPDQTNRIAGRPGCALAAALKLRPPSALKVTCVLLAVACNLARLRAGSIYTPYAFTNFAGAPRQSGIVDGLAGAARFDQPVGVATDRGNNIYVSDSAHTIRKISPSGMVTTWAGSPGASGTNDATGTNAQFFSPVGLAVDSAGNVYVADSGNHTVRKITAAAEVTTLAGKPGQPGSADGTNSAARFNNPEGVAVDLTGNVYVADTFNNTIRRISPAGVVTTLAGSAGQYGYGDGNGGDAQFASPMGLAVNAGGEVYVADSGNNCIRKIMPDGSVTTLAGNPSQFGFNDGAGSAAQFFSPQAVAVDTTGTIYVAEETDDTIRRITPGGVVTTLAGTPSLEGSADGIGNKALFYGPVGVAVDGVGNLFVADANNARITRGTQSYLEFRTSRTSLAFSNGLFKAWLTGPANQIVVLERSSDARQWLPVQTNLLPTGGLEVSLPLSFGPHGFVRSRGWGSD